MAVPRDVGWRHKGMITNILRNGMPTDLKIQIQLDKFVEMIERRIINERDMARHPERERSNQNPLN